MNLTVLKKFGLRCRLTTPCETKLLIIFGSLKPDGRLFCKDLYAEGQCAPVALNQSNENYVCKASKPERITSEQATALVKETGTRYIFSKVETDSQGNIVSFGQGV